MTRHIILSLLLLLPFTVGAADWMARLSPDTRVCRLLIPGTHDAATGDGFMPADNRLRQDDKRRRRRRASPDSGRQASVPSICALPCVPKTDGSESLHLYHGEFATTRSFGSVMRQIADSVTAHPRNLP